MSRLDDSAILSDIIYSFERRDFPYTLTDLKYAVIIRTGEDWGRKYLVSLLKDLEYMGVVSLNWEYKPMDSFLEMGKES